MFKIASVDFASDQAPSQFARSMRETGFAVIRNHPLDTALIDRLYQDWSGFFASPEKHEFLFKPEEQDGYFPFRSENAKGSPLKDLKEFYHVYPDRRLPASVKQATEQMYAGLMALGETLLSWLQAQMPAEVALELSQPLPDMIQGSKQCLFRVLHYPPIQEDFEPGAVRAAAHEDINLITLLVAGSEPGLQAQDTSGNWHDVPCDAGMIAVNGGDMLKVATDGYFPATPHRVVNPSPEHNVSRYSMPMFVHPRPEVQLSRDLTAGEYLHQRLKEIGLV